jgi:cysteine desulfurase / selenocysteine lyase
MPEEIYLDHAATSFPKPPDVMAAVAEWAAQWGASAGRGDYPRAVETGVMIRACRESIARLFGAEPDRVIFTLNCTDALNLAIRGLSLKAGERVIVGPTEHNSVMRPLNALTREIGIEVVRISGTTEGTFDPASVRNLITAKTRLCAVQHASNVLGAIHDIAAVGALCREHGVPLLVDAAQTAGAFPIDMESMNVDLLAMPGHKALQGPLGTGLLLVSPRVDLDPWRTGGTGSKSEEEWQPEAYPDRLEAGSHNAPGIAGLLGAVRWIEARGVEEIRRHEVVILERFLAGIARIEQTGGVRLIGPRVAAQKSPVAAIVFTHLAPAEAAARLWKHDAIMVRPGLHCAPSAHQAAGTLPHGAVRFSFGPFTTSEQIDHALEAIRRLAASTDYTPARSLVTS